MLSFETSKSFNLPIAATAARQGNSPRTPQVEEMALLAAVDFPEGEILLAVAFESSAAFPLEVGMAYQVSLLAEDRQGLRWVEKVGKERHDQRKELQDCIRKPQSENREGLEESYKEENHLDLREGGLQAFQMAEECRL